MPECSLELVTKAVKEAISLRNLHLGGNVKVRDGDAEYKVQTLFTVL